MRTPNPSTVPATPVSLRMPDDLIHWFKQQAAQNHRSFNSEIVYRLTQHRTQQEPAHV